jgi:heat shock protein HslJ
MKKILLALPVVLLFVNCRTTERTTTSIGSGTNSSTASGSTASSETAGTTSGRTGNSARFKGYDVTKYDPNNYMQNPEMYKAPSELARTGGWTYNTDWNKNTNFLAEALGEWLLEPTPEVAAFWIPDSSRADSYAAYWTPEAVAARQQAKMVALAAYNDSVARANGFSEATASTKKGKMPGVKRQGSATIGSGGTGEMGAGGVSGTTSTTTDNTSASTSNNNTTGSSTTANASDMSSGTSTVDNTKNYLMAVNGNKFPMPRLNLYLQNGTFVGFTGSNQLVGTLKVNGTQLRFDPTIPSTNIQPMGGFSQAAFMERLARVDSYDVTDGQLRLKQGNEIMFVLAKNSIQ